MKFEDILEFVDENKAEYLKRELAENRMTERQIEGAAFQLWLDSLQEGDEVAIESRSYGIKYDIYKVNRITPSRIIKVGSWTFDKSGRQRGDTTWGRGVYIGPITENVKKHIRRRKILHELKTAKFDDLHLKHLEQIYIALMNGSGESNGSKE